MSAPIPPMVEAMAQAMFSDIHGVPDATCVDYTQAQCGAETIDLVSLAEVCLAILSTPTPEMVEAGMDAAESKREYMAAQSLSHVFTAMILAAKGSDC